MAQFTTYTGILLAILGVAGYFASGMASPTALIPTGFGAALALLGMRAHHPERRKTAMHLAALVGVLGMAGSAQGVPAVFTMMTGGEVARPAAQVARALMFTVCLVFVVACIRSFIDARRARAKAA